MLLRWPKGFYWPSMKQNAEFKFAGNGWLRSYCACQLIHERFLELFCARSTNYFCKEYKYMEMGRKKYLQVSLNFIQYILACSPQQNSTCLGIFTVNNKDKEFITYLLGLKQASSYISSVFVCSYTIVDYKLK